MPNFFWALLAGAAQTASFAPLDLPALQLASLAALIALAQRESSWRGAARVGFAFGMGWFTTGISWVYVSMHDHGGMPAWIAASATVALAAYLALYPALAAAVAHRISHRPATRLLLAWPAAWALSEWLRGVVLTGFPWLGSGYAHADGPLAGFAPLLGVYGLSLLAAFIAGTAVLLLLRPTELARRWRWSLVLLTALLLGGGQALRAVAWTQPIGSAITVRLIQGNIPQDVKFAEGGTDLSVQQYLRMMPSPPQQHSDLVVLPESTFPVPFGSLPEDVQTSLLDFPQQQRTALILGAFVEEPGYRIYNSAIGLQDHEPPQRYSKRHLVPFGEFVPYGFHWFMDLMNIPMGDQDSGPAFQPPMQLAGQHIAVNICYEDLFGAEILKAWRDPHNQPTVMLNLSNLAWFDGSLAPTQHLQISRMRSLETRLPMLRATNTGATAIIDASGRVVAQLPFMQAMALEGQVVGRTGRTPYVRWGNAPVLALSALLLIGAAIAGRRP